MDDKHYRARITKRADFAPDLWMIRIDPGAEFSFAPGQYATLGIEREGRRLERPTRSFLLLTKRNWNSFLNWFRTAPQRRRCMTFSWAMKFWCAKLPRGASRSTPRNRSA